MSGIAPIGPMQEFSSNLKEEDVDRMEQKAAAQPPPTEPSPETARIDAQKKAENATLYAFRYTGVGSFIDKVF